MTKENTRKLRAPFPASCSELLLGSQHEPEELVRINLPTILLDSDDMIFLPSRSPEEFLKADLEVQRLNRIQKHLWWAGRPLPARPLHRQRMLGRQIILTQQADFHLLWIGQKIFIKPLPTYLFHDGTWSKYLMSDRSLHELARGFLLSYIWLVRHQSDFNIAKECGLLPEGITWTTWSMFVETLAKEFDFNRTDSINERYTYGELRIKRLNQICRFVAPLNTRSIIKGYASGYDSYGIFFAENFAWIFILFAYGSILLSALQVGIGVKQLMESSTFQRFSYVATLSAILLPFTMAGLIGIIFIALFVFHLVQTLAYKKRRERIQKQWHAEGWVQTV